MDVSKISGAAAFAPRRSALAAPEQRESLLEAFSRNGLLYSGDYIVNI